MHAVPEHQVYAGWGRAISSGENANIDGSLRGYIIDQRPKSNLDGKSFISIFAKAWSQFEKLLYLSGKCMGPSAYAWKCTRMVLTSMALTLRELHQNRPNGPINGTQRIVRGGSFVRTAHESRSAKRLSYEASYRGSEIGFRYVLGLPLR